MTHSSFERGTIRRSVGAICRLARQRRPLPMATSTAGSGSGFKRPGFDDCSGLPGFRAVSLFDLGRRCWRAGGLCRSGARAHRRGVRVPLCAVAPRRGRADRSRRQAWVRRSGNGTGDLTGLLDSLADNDLSQAANTGPCLRTPGRGRSRTAHGRHLGGTAASGGLSSLDDLDLHRRCFLQAIGLNQQPPE